MLPEIYVLTRTVAERKRLEITVRAYDGEDYAPLGLDLRGLQAVLVSAGIAEVAVAYWTFHLEQTLYPAYPRNVLTNFGNIISDNSSNMIKTWVDEYEDRERWLELYQSQINRRRGELWGVGDGEILHVALVELSKENPTVMTVIATGLTIANLYLASCFGGVHLMKQREAVECRQQYLDYSRQQADAILRQAKLEGHFTDKHNEAIKTIQDSLNKGIAACGSNLERIDLGIDGGRVTLSINRDAAKQSDRGESNRKAIRQRGIKQKGPVR
jgi:hypothetical protein